MTSFSALDRQIAALMRRVAETAILPRYQALADHEVIAKAANDMVTIADTEAEALLAEGLSAILPEAAIVGEEAVHADPALSARLDNGLCWIIDPVDGTNNFAAGKPPFGIILSLSDGGDIRSGWIYDPLQDRLCIAHKGLGAFVNGERVMARPTGQTPPIAAISTVFLDPAQRAQVQARIAPFYSLVDIPRCAAEQYPRLVLGVNDISVFERTLPWDHAAGVLFVNEAGGMAARPDGSPYRTDQHGQKGLFAASSPSLFEEFVKRVSA
ncbi:inositol monophosphatase family protein [Novosphingobium cyanobacteriorum]|uniref:Inositol monophosphatase family protein n=1 Tax=Novosphingobium cyanobacteriorum TaxID=3024215 RepID=A0ABT6CJM6_9SPHN|nr:inositol monophosphatase family protein [Novosphingobium cyanobacteriorum]MDF8334124.1 inositol monophosphatase family protein [Novosphingobium cyanobacteriorum]